MLIKQFNLSNGKKNNTYSEISFDSKNLNNSHNMRVINIIIYFYLRQNAKISLLYAFMFEWEFLIRFIQNRHRI